ncbi:MAG: relaxase/mobilization nuclease domain-containing protein [Cyclobacteriaceae bacterium]|nr:relaxase/mobilization nuclease domain-containing protein [Cyclobacteriaceae bacterium]
MTGNMIKGKGFKGALRYNLEKVEKGVAEVLDHSFVEVSEKTIMKEIQMIRSQRPNLKKFFYHTSINFPPNEDLSNQTMLQIGQDYLKESDFTQHHYIMFRHYDAGHPHLHILVSRIGYDGKVLSDSNDFAQCEKILRQLEKKYNLTQVPSSTQARQRAVTKDELEMMKRTNTPSHKVQLQAIIKKVLAQKSKPAIREFIRALEKKKVNVLFNQATTGYVSGISYSYEGITITGAKLGNDFKWASIKTNIDYDQQRDQQIIKQTNERTKRLSSNKNPQAKRWTKPRRTNNSFSLAGSTTKIVDELLNSHLSLLTGPSDLQQQDLITEDFIRKIRRRKKKRRRGF